MEIIRIILWVTAYTAGVVRLFVAVLLFARNREQEDFKKIIFLLTFGGIILSLSNMEVLNIFGSEKAGFAGSAGLVFSALLTASLPVYVHSAVFVDKTLPRDIASVAAGAISLLFLAFFGESIMFPVIIIMSASIIYSMVILISGSGGTEGLKKKSFEPLPVIVILLIILMILFDFIFPITDGYLFVPVLYFIVNIMMLVPELPRLSGQVGKIEDKALIEQMACMGLSRRECEVGILLVKGRTYQEIGEQLYISMQTVKTHAARIYSKTNTGSKLELLDKLTSTMG